MVQAKKQREEIVIPFAQLPAEAQRIIGSLGEVRKTQELNKRAGEQTQWGKDFWTRKLGVLEQNRLKRAIESIERIRFLDPKIAQTHKVVSVGKNGNLILRPPAGQEFEIRSRQRFQAGRFVLAEMPWEREAAEARARRQERMPKQAERLAANRALNKELKKRGAKIDPDILREGFWHWHRDYLGLAGRQETATGEQLIKWAPKTADSIIREQNKRNRAIAKRNEILAYNAAAAKRAAERRQAVWKWRKQSLRQKLSSAGQGIKSIARRTRRPM